MCYYAESNLANDDIYRLEHDFVVKWEEEERKEYHVTSGFSHAKMPVITNENRFRLLRWGLIPTVPWIRDWKDAMLWRDRCLNCVSEEMTEKPAFKGAIASGQFCLIPINGFYEWHTIGKEKYPHYIYPKNDKWFLVPGLYNSWINPAIDEVHETFTMLTTKANRRMEWIHNIKKRMPVILEIQEARIWLDKSVSIEEKKKFLKPYDQDKMADHSITKLITSKKENPNQAKVKEPWEYPELLLS